jgi:hypothetical protein
MNAPFLAKRTQFEPLVTVLGATSAEAGKWDECMIDQALTYKVSGSPPDLLGFKDLAGPTGDYKSYWMT